jgi:hypothetical protein
MAFPENLGSCTFSTLKLFDWALIRTSLIYGYFFSDTTNTSASGFYSKFPDVLQSLRAGLLVIRLIQNADFQGMSISGSKD